VSSRVEQQTQEEQSFSSNSRISNTLAPANLAKGLLSRFGYRWDAP
jgi:hypothetical protein